MTADHALYDRVPDSDVQTLLVGGELDLAIGLLHAAPAIRSHRRAIVSGA